jgi:hypothetical protein
VTGSRRRAVIACCAGFSVAVGGLAVLGAVVPHGWNVTGLVRMQSGGQDARIAAVARSTDPHFVLVREGRYDGVYYYAIARDPLARAREHRAIDEPAYRYGHPGYAWLAWIASAGRADAVPAALLAVGLLGLGVAGAAGSMLALGLGRTAWGGLLVGLNPGLIYAVTSDTSEAVGAALLLLALVAFVRGRHELAALATVPLCFVKEPFVLVPVALALWGVLHRRATRRTALLAVGPVLYAAWIGYVRLHLGAWSFSQGKGNLAAPLLGWKAALLKSGSRSFDPASGALTQIGQAAVPLLAVVGAALLLGLVVVLYHRLATPVDAVFLLQALLVYCASDTTLAFPKELMRTGAAALLLLPAVLARPPGPS